MKIKNPGLLGCLFNLVVLAVYGLVAKHCFDYCLRCLLGKDIVWYGDLIAGMFAAPLTVPGAIVFWVLELCGIAMPLIR